MGFMKNRLTKKQIVTALHLAKTQSVYATCPKKQVGAALLYPSGVATIGFNCAPSGHYQCNNNNKCQEENGQCQTAIHAEMGVIIESAFKGISTNNAILFCTHFPCNNCMKAIIAAGINDIYYLYQCSEKNYTVDLKQINITKVGNDTQHGDVDKIYFKKYGINHILKNKTI